MSRSSDVAGTVSGSPAASPPLGPNRVVLSALLAGAYYAIAFFFNGGQPAVGAALISIFGTAVPFVVEYLVTLGESHHTVDSLQVFVISMTAPGDVRRAGKRFGKRPCLPQHPNAARTADEDFPYYSASHSALHAHA